MSLTVFVTITCYAWRLKILEVIGFHIARLVERVAELAESDVGAHLSLDYLVRKVRLIYICTE